MALVAELLVKCLVDAEFPNVFPKNAPSSLDCEEPIVLVQGAFARESIIEGEERGTVPVEVMVVREIESDAEAVANAVEHSIRGASWERFAERWPWRIVGVDTTAPAFKERDSSGRYVWAFTTTMTAVRSV